MSFLNQALLFGAGAVAIPIIIHLLNRRRFRKVPWAAMRFLQVSVEQNQRRMKLEDLILLVLRCAMVALLAFALARPLLQGVDGVPGSKIASVIIIDNSGSMGAANGDGTRLDQAREAALAVVDRLPNGSAVAIATPFQPDEPSVDRELVEKRIRDVRQTSRHADLLRALEHAAEVLDGQSAAEKEIYLVTDTHAEEWSSFVALEERIRELSAGVAINLIQVGTPIPQNLGVSRLDSDRALPSLDQPLRMDVEVTNYGDSAAYGVPLQLLIDGQPEGEPWVFEEIAPGERKSASLYARLPSAGAHRVSVRLPADSVPVDDERTVVLEARDHVGVLLVDGDPGEAPAQAETFFLRHALVPVSGEERERYPVRAEVISPFDLSEVTLADYDLIVFANVAEFAFEVAAELQRFVVEGGGLAILPGANVRTEFYNTVLHTEHGLLPAKLIEDDTEASWRMEPSEFNPLGLERDVLSEARVQRRYQLELSGKGSAQRVAMRYQDGAPALLESDQGLGKVFLFTSTADLAWNNLAIQPGFVPFINRLLGAVVQNRAGQVNLAAGQPLHQRVDPALAGREATVAEVDDPQSLGRLTTIETEEDATILAFAETDRAGAYQVTIEGEATPVLFATQAHRRESTVDLLRAEQLSRLDDSLEVIPWRGEGTSLQVVRQGSELWLPLLLGVLALAVVELGLAQWFSRSK